MIHVFELHNIRKNHNVININYTQYILSYNYLPRMGAIV